MSLALYAPALENSQPPFMGNNLIINYFINNNLYSEIQEGYKIKYKLYNYYDAENDITCRTGYAEIKDSLIEQKNGYMGKCEIIDDTFFHPGNYYKIQLQIISLNEKDKTEFSNTLLIKHISLGEQKDAEISFIGNIDNTERILTNLPVFTGRISFSPESKEYVNSYKFMLLDKNNHLLEDSGWIIKQQNELINTFSFKYILKNYSMYKIKYSILTQNNYTQTWERQFQTSFNETFDIEGLDLFIEDNNIYAKENGCIQIYLSSKNIPITGIFLIKKSSEDSNFTQWETIYTFALNGEEINNKLIYNDFLVENNKIYHYAIQQQISEIEFSNFLFENSSNKDKKVNFEYSYLYDGERQLCLKLNYKISDFKYNVKADRIETLGSRFPTIIRNGFIHYAEFPINGLISFYTDNFHTFLTKKNNIYYYKENELFKDNNETDEFNNNITDKNIFIEKKFREAVENFLNNGENKVFKSPTEGNFIVNLTNIKFNPIQSLSRMIYNFSGTAYEIADYNFKNLKNFNLYRIKAYEEFFKENKEIKTFGQVNFSELITLNKGTNQYNIKSPDVQLDDDSLTFNVFNLIEKDLNKTNKNNFLISKIKSNSFIKIKIEFYDTIIKQNKYYNISIMDKQFIINKENPFIWEGQLLKNNLNLKYALNNIYDCSKILLTYEVYAINSFSRFTTVKNYIKTTHYNYWNQIAIEKKDFLDQQEIDLKDLIYKQIGNCNIEIIKTITIKSNTPISFKIIKNNRNRMIYLDETGYYTVDNSKDKNNSVQLEPDKIIYSNDTGYYFIDNTNKMIDTIKLQPITDNGMVLITYKCDYSI